MPCDQWEKRDDPEELLCGRSQDFLAMEVKLVLVPYLSGWQSMLKIRNDRG